MSPAELAVLGTLGGTIAGGLFSMVVAVVSKRSEERTKFRELVIQAAIENWKYVTEKQASKFITPLSTYIVHTSKMCDLALSGDFNEQTAKGELAKVNRLMEIMIDNANDVYERARSKAKAEAEKAGRA